MRKRDHLISVRVNINSYKNALKYGKNISDVINTILDVLDKEIFLNGFVTTKKVFLFEDLKTAVINNLAVSKIYKNK